jgi:hypothetical protein
MTDALSKVVQDLQRRPAPEQDEAAQVLRLLTQVFERRSKARD